MTGKYDWFAVCVAAVLCAARFLLGIFILVVIGYVCFLRMAKI